MLKTIIASLLILAGIITTVFYLKPKEPTAPSKPETKQEQPENKESSLPVVASFPNGSWIKCNLLDPEILFRTHRDSLLRIPSASMSLLNFSNGTTKTTLNLTNGGKYFGQMLGSSLHLEAYDSPWEFSTTDLLSVEVPNDDATPPPLPTELQGQITAIEKTTSTFTTDMSSTATEASSTTLLLLENGSRLIGKTAPLNLLPDETITLLERLESGLFHAITDKSNLSTHTLKLSPINITLPWGKITVPADSVQKIIRPGSRPKPPVKPKTKKKK